MMGTIKGCSREVKQKTSRKNRSVISAFADESLIKGVFRITVFLRLLSNAKNIAPMPPKLMVFKTLKRLSISLLSQMVS